MSKPITPILLALFAAVLPATLRAQGCLPVVACPNAGVHICDVTSNDELFWNAPPFTWSPGLQDADLPEGAADLSLELQDTCPGTLTVKFVLFLDLDGDNLSESVLSSDQILPPGKMLAGNAFNPGYAGTDTLEFDSRAVPDSMKFHFVVETQNNAGTVKAFLRWETESAPGNYISPRYPEGRHRILWTIVKNGLPKAFCEYTFRVKDCQEPMLSCNSGWTKTLTSSDTLWLQASDFLQSATDNITPLPLLEYSLRRSGTGSGFPLNDQEQPVVALPFTCADQGQQFVELWVRDLTGNTAMCEGDVVLFDAHGYCVPPVIPMVCAAAVFVQQDTIQDVTYSLETLVETGLPPVHLSATPLANGCVELPDFSPYFIEEVAVTPHKNNDPLNGVSTFDLVLINRHILGVELFNKPWKYLAADANNSGTISTFDIIELRKLILGVYDTLPHSTAWKFFMADCALDTLNPFNSACPGSIVFVPEFPPNQYLFYGIKTGDVNGNAHLNAFSAEPEQRSRQVLSLPDRVLAAGESFELPLILDEPGAWAGCQGAFHWDTMRMQIETVLPGVLPGFDASMSARPAPGLLTFSWSDAQTHWLLPDAPLFYLKGRALAPLRLSEALQLSPERLRPEAYDATGAEASLTLHFRQEAPETPASDNVFPPQPNPTTGGARFPVRLEEPATALLDLWDATGHPVYHAEVEMATGASALELPADTVLPPGVYVWRVQVGQATKSGRLLRW